MLYLLLREGADSQALEAKLGNLVARIFEPEARQGLSYHLQPLAEVHLYSQRDYGLGRGGDISQVYQLSGLAAFVLAIACVNFANLSTACGALRSGEVALRQTLGATRAELMLQYWLESIAVATVAVAAALAITHLVLPEVNAFAGTRLSLDSGLPGLWATVLALVLGIGGIAGAYPAAYLSSLRPSVALRDSRLRGSSAIRSGLVAVQFTASIVLISAVLVSKGQMDFVGSRDLGLNREDVVIMWRAIGEGMEGRVEQVKNAFLQHPDVLMASASHYPPGTGDLNPTGVRVEGESQHRAMVRFTVDPDFLDLYGIPLVAGRGFSHDRAEDRGGTFILNETAVRALGSVSPEDALGTVLRWLAPGIDGTVVGVVRDFHIKGLHHPLEPMFLVNNEDSYRTLSLRVRPGVEREKLLTELARVFHRFQPGQPFEGGFLSDAIGWDYWRDRQMGKLFQVAALVGVGISCLGMLALSAFVTSRRTREIGIRRVLGATERQVALQLLRDLSVPVLIAAAIAIPISYRVAQWILEPFAYRMPLGIGLLVASGLIALVLANLTTLWQVLRVVRANPVDAIRHE